VSDRSEATFGRFPVPSGEPVTPWLPPGHPSQAPRCLRGVADNPAMPATPRPRFLAIETSTDTLSIALGGGAPAAVVGTFTGPGAARASTTLLPAVQSLLSDAGWALHELDAIVFGRGPGSFTGLRTACAVAQGLAYGAQAVGRPGGVPVLPVDTLLAVADEALQQRLNQGLAVPAVVAALLDARMDEMYVALYAVDASGVALSPLTPPRLCAPPDLGPYLAQQVQPEAAGWLLAGNVFETYGAQISDLPGVRQTALPTAEALLRLAPRLLAAGLAVKAQDALPLYVRDKVAQTTAERETLRLSNLARLAEQAPSAPLDV
jgi:tRNA threonylcarbamoyladenosine biosynthesis protein TsaB